jgi:hypothetical protein
MYTVNYSFLGLLVPLRQYKIRGHAVRYAGRLAYVLGNVMVVTDELERPIKIYFT